MVPGYVPGYYPHGPYRWPDVYGYWYYQPPIATNATLAIDFGLLARGQLIAEIRDAGTFSPNVEIKHAIGASPLHLSREMTSMLHRARSSRALPEGSR